ncbi:hypothetical protein RvY_00592 [Ramazzottius varieornatus]|uniref:Uncharacterized protein n=1 Tax=Ramazzottius varieornatus TaxID=947166 RepID=A0A1D1UDB0_RAMVA|nr:hypothetical protein RvY_00592 [Ramazzottius varieornatus]
MDGELISADELSDTSTEIMKCFQTLHGTADETILSQLASVVLKIHSQAVNMANRLEDNQDRISLLQRQVEEFERNNGDLRTALRIDREQHEQTVSKIDADFSKELGAYKKELEKMKTENRNVKAMNDRLMAEVQELEAACLRNETLTKESIDELEKTKKELEETQDALDEARRSERKALKIVVDSASQTSVEVTFGLLPPMDPEDTDGKRKVGDRNEGKGSGDNSEYEDIDESQNSSTSEEAEDDDEEEGARRRRSKCPSVDEKKFHNSSCFRFGHRDVDSDETILKRGMEEGESGIEEEEHSLEEELSAVGKSEVQFDEDSNKSDQLVEGQMEENSEGEPKEPDFSESEDETIELAHDAILNSVHKLVAMSDRVMDHIDDVDGPTELEKLFSGCVAKRTEVRKGGSSSNGAGKGKKNSFVQCCGMVLFVAGLYLLCDFLCERYLGFGIFRLTRRRPGYTTAMF